MRGQARQLSTDCLHLLEDHLIHLPLLMHKVLHCRGNIGLRWSRVWCTVVRSVECSITVEVAVVIVAARRVVVEVCGIVLLPPPILLFDRVLGIGSGERRSWEVRWLIVEGINLLGFFIPLREWAVLILVPFISTHNARLWLLITKCFDTHLVKSLLHGIQLGRESGDLIDLESPSSSCSSVFSAGPLLVGRHVVN